jgi:hypothetical protein
MSLGRFAPITADLLARKGEAAPSLAAKRVFDWTHGLRVPSRQDQDVWPGRNRGESKSAREHISSDEEVSVPGREKSRRIVVSLAVAEFERLGIAAAKKDMTRHELVQTAIRSYFNMMFREFGNACWCLSGANNGTCGSCSETNP